MKSVILNGVEYGPKAAVGERMRLVIVDNRGLMFVGRVDLDGDDEQIVIHDARCVMYWGTSGHVAELVSGPTATTKLGARADVTVFRRNLIAAYDVTEEAWS